MCHVKEHTDRVVVKFRMTGSKLNNNKMQKRHVLTADIFDHTGPRKVTSPSISLHQLAVQSGVSKSSVRQATKLKTTTVYSSPQIYVISTRFSRRQVLNPDGAKAADREGFTV
jgi:hypothetical protein